MNCMWFYWAIYIRHNTPRVDDTLSSFSYHCHCLVFQCVRDRISWYLPLFCVFNNIPHNKSRYLNEKWANIRNNVTYVRKCCLWFFIYEWLFTRGKVLLNVLSHKYWHILENSRTCTTRNSLKWKIHVYLTWMGINWDVVDLDNGTFSLFLLVAPLLHMINA